MKTTPPEVYRIFSH